MRRYLISALTILLAVVGLTAVRAPSAGAASECTFTPTLPKRISVGQNVVELKAGIKVSGAAACTNDLDVSAQLVHSTDSYFLSWDNLQPDVESVYAFEVKPGRYSTTAGDCLAFDSDFNQLTCTVAPASTVIKFAAHPKLSMSRKKSTVTFHTWATRYADTLSGSAPMTARVSIQKLSGGKWHTIHAATAKGRTGYTWHHKYTKKASYRVVSAETASAFAGTSGTSKK